MNRMKNRVFTAYWNPTLAPAATLAAQFQILSNYRNIKLKSLMLSWWMRNTTVGNIVMPQNNTNQNMSLTIGAVGTKIADAFQSTGGTAPTTTGNEIYIFEPGQWLFDSFFINNSVGFNLAIQNNDGANTFLHFLNIVCETEESIIY